MSQGSQQSIHFSTGSSPSDRREGLLEQYLVATKQLPEIPKKPTQLSKLVGPVLWVSQSSVGANEVRRLIAFNSRECRLQPGVRTLGHLGEAIASMSAIDWHPLSKVQQREMVRRLVAERKHRGTLGLLEELASSRGLVNFLCQRFDQLREIKISGDESADFLIRNEGRVGNAIASLYSAYCKQLKSRGIFDKAARYAVATNEIMKSSATIPLLIIDRWLPDSPVERELLSALITVSQKVFVSVYGRQSDSLSDLNDWKQLLTNNSIKHQVEQTEFQTPIVSDQVWASQHVFDIDQQSRQNNPTTLELIAAVSEQEEVRQVARRVKRLLVEDGASMRSVVLATNQLPQWRTRIESVFAEYGIPFIANQVTMIRQSPWFQLVGQVVSLNATDWKFENLLALLTRADLSRLSECDRRSTEEVIRSLGIPSGRSYVIQQVQGMGSATCSQAVEVLELLENLCDQLPEEATPVDWFDALSDSIQGLGYAPSNEIVPVNEAAKETLLKGLADLESSLNQNRTDKRLLNCRDLLHYLNEWSELLTLSLPMQEEGKVRVVSAEQALDLDIDHLFLLGASESSFAGLTDGYSLHIDPAKSLQKQRIVFQQVLAAPSQSLTISYTALDSKAQAMQPSPFVTELERLFPSGSLRRESYEIGKLQFLDEPCSLREQRLTAMTIASEGESRGLKQIIAQSSPETAVVLLNNTELIVDRWMNETHGTAEGIIASNSAKQVLQKQFGPEHHWSASQLELYANCPYKFFARYVLKAIPFEESRFDIDHRRRGSLLHDAMVEFHAALMKKLGAEDKLSDLPSSTIREALRDAISLVGHGRNLPNHEISLAEIELTETLAWADLYPEQYQKFDAELNEQFTLDEPLKPRFFEARFGPSRAGGADDEVEDSISTDEAYTLELPGGERLLLIGKIDRIDVGKIGDQTLFGIVDYKTGKVGKTKQDQINSGTKLQLALYALAAEELFFAQEDAKLLAAGYWEIKKNGFQGLDKVETAQVSDGGVEATDDWQATLDTVRERVDEMVTGIRQGEFPVYNSDENCGQTCEFKTICRINQIRSRDKIWPPLDEPVPSNSESEEKS